MDIFKKYFFIATISLSVSSFCASFEHLPVELHVDMIKKLPPHEQLKMKLVSHSLLRSAQIATVAKKEKSFKMYLLYPHLAGFDFNNGRGWLKKSEKVLKEILQDTKNKKMFYDMFLYYAAPEFFYLNKLQGGALNLNISDDYIFKEKVDEGNSSQASDFTVFCHHLRASHIFKEKVDQENPSQASDFTVLHKLITVSNNNDNKNSEKISMVYLINFDMSSLLFDSLPENKKQVVFEKIVKDVASCDTEKLRIVFGKNNFNINIPNTLRLLLEQIKKYDNAHQDKKVIDNIQCIDICPLYVNLLESHQSLSTIQSDIDAIEKILTKLQHPFSVKILVPGFFLSALKEPDSVQFFEFRPILHATGQGTRNSWLFDVMIKKHNIVHMLCQYNLALELQGFGDFYGDYLPLFSILKKYLSHFIRNVHGKTIVDALISSVNILELRQDLSKSTSIIKKVTDYIKKNEINMRYYLNPYGDTIMHRCLNLSVVANYLLDTLQKLLSVFLEHHLDIHAKNLAGETILELFLRSIIQTPCPSVEHCVSRVNFCSSFLLNLIQAGIDLNALTSQGTTIIAYINHLINKSSFSPNKTEMNFHKYILEQLREILIDNMSVKKYEW